MGACSYCGKSAGILRSKHKECSLKHNEGLTKIQNLVEQAILNSTEHNDLEVKLTNIAETNYITKSQTKQIVIKGWEQTVDHFLEDGNLDANEETQLTDFMNRFSLDKDDLNQQGAYSKVVKGAILRDLMNGKIPQRVQIDGTLPFNFQKSEELIWLFTGVPYYEDKTRKEYVGGYHGVSVRIAKGVYYRTGSFKGHPIEKTERVLADAGLLAITTKHIYFAGSTKSFRIRLDKIVTFMPYDDGIGIQRDAATAKPQIFITNDGWFTYNLLLNVSNL